MQLDLAPKAPAAGACPAPLVSVVVVTYQSRRHLPDLLHSLRAQTLQDFELVHVDSCSTDATREVAAHHWPFLRRVWARENLGYRRGNQWGMDRARGKYILLLNDDVELHPKLLEALVACAEADPGIAVVAPAILMHGAANTLNAAGSELLPAGFYAARGKNHPYTAFCQPADVAAASGCCLLLRRSFAVRCGGFAPIFDTLPSGWHASAEDLDLCWRAWRQGWRVRYQPNALLWHKYAQKTLDPSRFASLVAGRLVFIWLSYPVALLRRLTPILIATECGLLAYCLLRGRRYVRIWWAGWYWVWRNQRRLAELRGLRQAEELTPPSNLLFLMQARLVLAPDLRRRWVVQTACHAWFWMNAACLRRRRRGTANLQESQSGPQPGQTPFPTILQFATKRSLDLLGASGLLVLGAPLLLLLAVLVRVQLGSPILFRQTRIGKNEKPFTLLKFRSMRNAIGANGAPLPDAERLTPFGTWLRSWSLDELPQLWNILRGEMSFIGPRPLLPEYLPRYSPPHRARHLVRPGLSGLAQVNGRNASSWRKRLDLDVEYVERASLWLDAAIAWRTLRKLLGREGISRAGAATMPEFQGLHNDV